MLCSAAQWRLGLLTLCACLVTCEEKQQWGEPLVSWAQEAVQTSPDFHRGKRSRRAERLEMALLQVYPPISRLSGYSHFKANPKRRWTEIRLSRSLSGPSCREEQILCSFHSMTADISPFLVPHIMRSNLCLRVWLYRTPDYQRATGGRSLCWKRLMLWRLRKSLPEDRLCSFLDLELL